MKMSNNDLSVFEEPKYKGSLEPEQEKKPISKKSKKAEKEVGRPTKKLEKRKTEPVKLYLTPLEKAKFEKKAVAFGIQIPLHKVLRQLLEDSDYI